MKLIWPKKGNIEYLVGIDEVGRGPLAGPVTLGMFVLPKKSISKFKGILKNISLKDSKQLSEIQRVEIVRILKSENAVFYTSSVSAKVLDKQGISKSIKSAIKRLLKKLNHKKTHVRLDGLLSAPLGFSQETIIKGDEKDPLIALASIVAKVKRDTYMMKNSQKYPQYNFHLHKGYGTSIHRKAIKKHGMCDLHRRSFCKNI